MGSAEQYDASDLMNWARELKGEDASYCEMLTQLQKAQQSIEHHPYCLPVYVILAQTCMLLAYPDLAAGSAYKALLLSDAIQDESDEYHEVASESLSEFTKYTSPAYQEQGQGTQPTDSADGEDTAALVALVTETYLPTIYDLLIRGLGQCGSYKSASNYYSQSAAFYPNNHKLRLAFDEVRSAAAKHFGLTPEELQSGEHSNPSDWPDHGLVRREDYPWNTHEPSRLENLEELNDMMSAVAPKLQVETVSLPLLTLTGDEGTIQQLGVFAKEDVAPGEIVLDERSILTANNRLQDALCDACSSELPALGSPDAESTVPCPECEIVFCSQRCYDEAVAEYHPSLCGMDIEAVAKDVPPLEAPDSLYSLLLLRTFAMAETRDCHPLDLKEVKYLWGDFRSQDPDNNPELSDEPFKPSPMPKGLPFSFEYNIRLPFHMLEKMDIDIFANPQYDVWVFNLIYAKFRGTASARLSGQGSSARRGPEVAAVHPMWCLGNHSCDPNVSWEWGGSIKFWVKDPRATWKRTDGETRTTKPGMKKGEELLNHYCDVDLSVKERREWLQGTLGGDCRCARCVWEAGESGQDHVGEKIE